MTRRIGLILVAVAAIALTLADASDAQARRHRNGGSWGGDNWGSNGGRWGGGGSHGGSFGGLFSRLRNGSHGGFGSNGGHGSNGGYGSNGGRYHNGCGSHGGEYGVYESAAVQYGEETVVGSVDGQPTEVRYYDDSSQPAPATPPVLVDGEVRSVDRHDMERRDNQGQDVTAPRDNRNPPADQVPNTSAEPQGSDQRNRDTVLGATPSNNETDNARSIPDKRYVVAVETIGRGPLCAARLRESLARRNPPPLGQRFFRGDRRQSGTCGFSAALVSGLQGATRFCITL